MRTYNEETVTLNLNDDAEVSVKDFITLIRSFIGYGVSVSPRLGFAKFLS